MAWVCAAMDEGVRAHETWTCGTDGHQMACMCVVMYQSKWGVVLECVHCIIRPEFRSWKCSDVSFSSCAVPTYYHSPGISNTDKVRNSEFRGMSEI